MSRLFGWSLPPGVSHLPGDEDVICDVCKQVDTVCSCPECSVCGDVGNPVCYHEHGLKMTKEQWLGRARAEIAEAEERVVDAKMNLEQMLEIPTEEFSDWAPPSFGQIIIR